jgi:cupin 2 domain-containing protein
VWCAGDVLGPSCLLEDAAMSGATGNLFAAIPSAAGDGEIFEQLLQHGATRIERIISRGHTSPENGWYRQEHNEWVVVLRGGALVSYDSGEEFRLSEGGYLNIPAGTAHRVAWTCPEVETIWLAVHY